MGFRVFHHLEQLIDDMLRCRLVGIPHAEVDDVVPLLPRRRLQAVDFSKNIGRQALDAMKFFGHAAFIRGF